MSKRRSMTVGERLAIIWVASLAIALCVVEAYFFRRDSDGIPLLIPHERGTVYPPLVGIYASTIGPILAALFVRPFKPSVKHVSTATLGRIAIGLTLFYNVVLIYIIAQGHWQQSNTIEEILDQAKLAGVLLFFLVVPVNGYYFGIKEAIAP